MLREKYDDDNFVLQVGGCFWMGKVREELIQIQKVIKRVVKKKVLQEKSFFCVVKTALHYSMEMVYSQVREFKINKQ